MADAPRIHVHVHVHTDHEPAAKAAEGDAIISVAKADEERRYTLGVAYPAMKADVGVAMDGRTDFMSAEELEKTAWAWTAKSRQIGLFHADGTEGHGTPVESYIYRGPDWTVEAPDGSTQVIKAGDWLVGTVWDPIAWGLVKKGLLGGYSPQGRTRLSKPSPERLAELRT